MIKLLQANHPSQSDWLPRLTDSLRQHVNNFFLSISVDLIIDKILRNEYAVFNANDELIVIGYIFNDGIDRTFCVYWTSGKNIQLHFYEFFEYLKDNLSCVKIEFRSHSKIHNRFYQQILRKYNPCKSSLFSLYL